MCFRPGKVKKLKEEKKEEQKEELICTSCKKANPIDAKTCESCGKELAK